jgi:hypothetical protein
MPVTDRGTVWQRRPPRPLRRAADDGHRVSPAHAADAAILMLVALVPPVYKPH